MMDWSIVPIIAFPSEYMHSLKSLLFRSGMGVSKNYMPLEF